MNHQETKFIIAFKIKIFALNNQVVYFSPPWVKKQKKKLQAQEIKLHSYINEWKFKCTYD